MRHAESRYANSTRGAAIASRRLAAAWLIALASVITVAFILAPVANAGYGIVGKYDFQPTYKELRHAPGEMFDLRAVGINFDGSGAAAPGDLYVQDAGGSTCCGGGSGQWGVRLQQVSEAGNFKRLWGIDTIANGPDNADETQAVRVRATGGSYTLTFNGQTTGSIAYDATANTVETQLEALASIGGASASVGVSGGTGDALGTSPYLVTFGGTAGGVDLPVMTADSSSLSGGAATATVVTTNPGNVGFEVCVPSQGDVCKKAPRNTGDGKQNIFVGGGLGDASTIEVDQPSGAVYSAGFNRVTKFSASGDFLRLFGFDVVRSGPGDSGVNEQQRVQVIATGGTFTISMSFNSEGGGFKATDQIPYDAPASAPPNPGTAGPDSVEEAINNMLATVPSLAGVSDRATVTGGPGGPGNPTPYVVDFGGSLGGDDLFQFEGSAANLTGTPKAVLVTTLVDGGGYEICTAADLCKVGVDDGSTGSIETSLSTPGNHLAVAPAGTGNEGNVLITEPGRSRVSEYTGNGNFVRAFGWDVVSSGADDSTAHEVQEVELGPGTTGGKYSLSFNGVTTGASGVGNVASGSNTITSVITTNGAFAEGQTLSAAGIPAETTITSVGASSLTLSANATSTGNNLTLTANDIDYNASAAQIETKLNALPTIGGVGGSVSASGGPGTVNPIVVTFGGTLGGDNVAQLTSSTEGLAGVKTVTISTSANGGAFEVCTAAAGSTCKAGQSGTALGQFDGLGGVEEDSSGAIYTAERSGARRVQKFVAQVGPPELLPTAWGTPGAPTGTSDENAPVDMGIGPADDVFVAKKFLAGAATCESGPPSPAEERVQRLSSDGLTLDEASTSCNGIDSGNFFFYPAQEFDVDPATGAGFLTVSSSSIPGGEDHVLVFGDAGGPAELVVDAPSNVSGSGVTISGTVDPNGPSAVPYPNPAFTQYRVEFKKVTDATWQVFSPDVTIGGGSSPVPFSVGINGLEPKTEYEARVVATKPYGFAPLVQATPPFTTLGAPPAIDGFSSDNVTATSADLKALINPRGTETSYHFEYGTTPAYGSSTPELPVGSQLSAQPVQVHLEGLDSVVYHFRVVATSTEGTVVSTNQTFNFYPEPCPNDTVRQQTGSGGLPDCRAYELVSPGNAGTALLRSGGPSAAHASSPARFAFHGIIGGVPGPWNIPTGFEDNTYISTRGPGGWETNYVGFPADVTMDGRASPFEGTNARAADLSLDTVLEMWDGRALIAPYVWNAKGESLGRWPTNLGELSIPDKSAGEGGPTGVTRPSPDFSHLFISASNVALAPGGLTTGVGSVYDNEIATKDVTIASKLPGGGDIPPEPGGLNGGHYLLLPSVSTDGSHALMAAPAACTPLNTLEAPCSLQPSHLYMRVGGAVTYDVSQGNQVNYVGTTGDGSKVFFTSAQALTGDDNDTSVDLYMWKEDTDSLVRVSAGTGPVGDTDACNTTWTAKCGIEVVPFSNGGVSRDNLFGGRTGFASDNSIGADNGAIYFYSPEQFVGTAGIPGRRNLYVARDGQLQYVTTFEVTKPAKRIQVSPNGSHAAFVTESELTPQDNAGFDQMYTFEASTGTVLCASCNPTGAPPTSDVFASDNGLFMADDGRAFFTTDTPILSRDTNNGEDVYEFVDSRPRLITTGAAAPDPSRPTGLVGVSADGVDVYFSTLATLVPGDQNGRFVKFYDARTNGGFRIAAEVAPCKAADECHAAGSSEPSPSRVSSSAGLGSAGNVTFDNCALISQRARGASKQARVLRNRAKKAASGEQAAALRKKARSLDKKAKQAEAEARLCKAQRRRS